MTPAPAEVAKSTRNAADLKDKEAHFGKAETELV